MVTFNSAEPGRLKESTVSFKNFADMSKEDSELIMARVPDMMADACAMILSLVKSLQHQPRYGLPVDQLQHALQTATRAVRDNANDEQVLMSLCHDIGKAISPINHPAIGAEIMRPFLSDTTYSVILHHADFQGRYSYPHRGQDPLAYRRFEHEPWFELALRFSDAWDCPAFDPSYPSLPLSEFEPLIEQACSKKRWARNVLHAEPKR
jgi:predicted HD phosphohydrolase